MSNTKSTRGRKPLKIKFPQGAFTVDQLFALNSKENGGNVKCELTARNHIKRGLASGTLVKLAEKLTTGKVGAPAYKFILASRHKQNEARRAKRAAKTAPAETANA